jgi:hypothetical protein
MVEVMVAQAYVQLTCCRLHMRQVRLLRRLSSKRGWSQQAQPAALPDKSKVWTAQCSSQPRCGMLALPALTVCSCEGACCCEAICTMKCMLLALQPWTFAGFKAHASGR